MADFCSATSDKPMTFVFPLLKDFVFFVHFPGLNPRCDYQSVRKPDLSLS